MNTELTERELPWEEQDWLLQVGAWIEDRLRQHGWRASGSLQIVHQRPWSTFASLATDHGIVYFKAPAPAFADEAALTEALARWRPDCTVPLLGVDAARGWMLSAAAGETLRSLLRSPQQVEHWLKILPLYAGLQQEMSAHVAELVALGVPDRRLARLPLLYAALLDDKESLLLGQESGLTYEEYRRLQQASTRIETMCAQLAAFGLPAMLVHEEVHENNVIYDGKRYTFTDWSDCSVGHPFFSMLVTVRTLVHWLKLDEHGPEIAQVRDAYLEPWTAYASRAELATALGLAEQLAMVNRALSWHHGLSVLSHEQKADYADSVAGWLQDFLIAAAGS